jgi:hypothetical protein
MLLKLRFFALSAIVVILVSVPYAWVAGVIVTISLLLNLRYSDNNGIAMEALGNFARIVRIISAFAVIGLGAGFVAASVMPERFYFYVNSDVVGDEFISAQWPPFNGMVVGVIVGVIVVAAYIPIKHFHARRLIIRKLQD